MSESKHTKGPWHWEYSEGLRKRLTTNSSDVLTAAVTDALAESYVDIDEPDACLIAAAPELLEACEAIDALMENLWKAIDWGKSFNLDVQKLNEAPIKIKRAIAKAKGEA